MLARNIHVVWTEYAFKVFVFPALCKVNLRDPCARCMRWFPCGILLWMNDEDWGRPPVLNNSGNINTPATFASSPMISGLHESDWEKTNELSS